jgi:hypothetical protein
MTKRVLIVTVVVGIVAGIATLASRSSTPPARQMCRTGLFGDDPLGGGVQMSLQDAERALDTPVVRPQIGPASDASIAELWVRPERFGQVYITYESGIIVTIRPWTRPTWELARDFTADGSAGELIEVQGIDVFTVPPQRPCFGGNAVFNIGGAHVAVINDPSLPFDVVAETTESIIETAPAAIAADAAAETN